MLKKFKEIIQSSLNLFGYEIVVHDKLLEKEFKEIYEKCKNYTMTSKERMYVLYKAVEYIVKAKIPGDFVECGVWKGGSTMVIAYTLLKIKDTKRKIYLYDTYEGMPGLTKEDKTFYNNKVAKGISNRNRKDKKWLFSSLEEVKKNMFSTRYPSKNIIFVKGKVEDTIPKTMPSKITLLRLDTDWYESTKHELIHLYPKLLKGGVLIIDDYGHWAGSKKATDEYFKKKLILLNRIDYSGRIGIKL